MPTRLELANAIRMLSIEAVQRANSGHPGMPMGMADIAEVLWNDFLRHNPQEPDWFNRDRFVLSNGHGSMLLYSLLHLTGYDVSIDDLKAFRQLHSKTPGHPECDMTPGVETTTGPLGQGFANAVGMAIAETQLAAHFNRPGFDVIDHHTYAFVGDGCLMEGISHEAASLAGTLGLGKLITLWDNNGISIDGDVEGWFNEDVAQRFAAYGWHVVTDVDGHNPSQIHAALVKALSVRDKPSLICCKTKITYGSPNFVGTEAKHGAPLGEAEIELVKQELNWPHAAFEVPQTIYEAWDAREQGYKQSSDWKLVFQNYQKAHPDLAKEFTRRINNQLPEDWAAQSQTLINTCAQETKPLATRAASKVCLEQLSQLLPELCGGSADLSGSNCTLWDDAIVYSKHSHEGRYIEYGVREFGMSAMMNGMALHKGIIPFGGTFLTFSDYARNAVRMAALMQQRSIFVYTHDSIGLGEDGPTHQPIEHLATLRMIPNVIDWRPCDLVECAVAWQQAIEKTNNPSCLFLSRQKLNPQPRSEQQIELIRKGGYILKDSDAEPDVILIATGSEVELAMQVANQTSHNIRVVSMPSTKLFDQQDNDYKQSVLPSHIKNKIAIEAGIKDGWYKYVGLEGQVIGLDSFGVSAPGAVAFNELGITAEHIKQVIND